MKLRWLILGSVGGTAIIAACSLAAATVLPNPATPTPWIASTLERVPMQLATFPPRATRTAIPQFTPPPRFQPGDCSCVADTLSCDDFPSRRAAQECFDACAAAGAGDVYRLDADDDLYVCEAFDY